MIEKRKIKLGIMTEGTKVTPQHLIEYTMLKSIGTSLAIVREVKQIGKAEDDSKAGT